MEIYTLVGMRDVDFKAQDGGQVTGWNFFFTYEDAHITGVGVEKVFIGNKTFNNLSFVPQIGGTCQLLYNKYGKVADIIKA